MTDFDPKLVVFLCHWCSYEGADAAGRGRKELPSRNLREVRVMCSGRVDPRFVLEAFRVGAHGVLILGCASGDCHYRSGNIEMLKRIPLLERILEQYGIESERIRFDAVSAGEGEKYGRLATDMVKRLKEMGPLKNA
jgi:F420-non-reducing hydrogenase iron-sulfur subunit